VRHVPVSGDDWSRLGDDAERLTHWIANRPFMRIEAGRCVALARRGDRLACTIYERRPELCRALEQGWHDHRNLGFRAPWVGAGR